MCVCVSLRYPLQQDTTGCAPIYITIGDGGNVEGPANEFSSAENCPKPNFPTYQPQNCTLYNQGPGSGCPTDTAPCFCYTRQVTHAQSAVCAACACAMSQLDSLSNRMHSSVPQLGMAMQCSCFDGFQSMDPHQLHHSLQPRHEPACR